MGNGVGLVREELEDLYWNRGMTTREIAELKGCCHGSVLNYMKKFGIKTRSLQEALEKKKPNVKIDFNKKKSLAYILGVKMGDGYVTRNRRSYIVGLRTTSKIFAESFARTLEDVGANFFMSMRREKGNRSAVYCPEASSRMLYEWLKGMDAERAKEFLGDDKELIEEFLRGFYESEGTLVCKSETNKQIHMSNTDADVVELVKKLLEKLDFKVSVRKYARRNSEHQNWRDEYRIYILGGTSEAMRFLNEIRPYIKNTPYSGRWVDIEGRNISFG